MKFSTFNQCRALALAALWLVIFTSVRAQTTKAQARTTSPRPIGYPDFVDKAVTWPMDGAVFQQDGNGKGQITVLGFLNSTAFEQGYYTTRASLQPLDVKTGNPLPGGTTINQNIMNNGTFFNTTLTNVNAGWYALRVTFTPRDSRLRSYSVTTTRPWWLLLAVRIVG